MQDTIMRIQNTKSHLRSNEKQLIVQKWIDNPTLIGRRRTKETRRLVRESFKSTNDIYTEVLHLSLSCPITKRRIKLPCISTFCEHVACFDGEAFLSVNKCRAIWHCPICNITFDLEDIRIDSLIERILSNTPNDCLRVSLDHDSDWKELTEVTENRRKSRKSILTDEIIILDDKEKHIDEKDINVIIILDSDDDEDADDDKDYLSTS
ncbi:uncharacterized protein LOC128387776 [Panonychus citri]|uniref:uncharacterized protein LOC128387776 n=1 Tax=Panonychus citri TaxID=50023 RepID=UPI00230702A2|nr:uncharacterized protein LOC128387776 [Panonychus citri]